MNLFSRRPLALFSLLFLLSSLLTYLIHANGMSPFLGLIPFAVFLFVAPLTLLRRKGHALLPFGIAIVLLLGVLVQSLYNDVRHRPWKEADAGAPHTLLATVTDHQREEGGITYTLSVNALDGRNVRLRLLLIEAESGVTHSAGTQLRCYVTVAEQASRKHYREGVAGTARALSVTVIGREERPLSNALADLRTLLSDRIREGISGDAAALTVALLLGDREGLSASLTNDFQRAGLSHMLALSGLHLSILAMLLLRLLRELGTPRYLSFPLLLLFLLTYTTISGFPLSLVRAALMLTVAELARLLRLSTDPITSLFFSVALIVFLSPGAITDIGLLLSFLATLGVLIAMELFPHRPRSLFRRVFSALLLSLLSTVFAIAFTLPVTALVFGGISLISPLSNLLVSPLLHLVLLFAPLLLLFPTAIGPLAGTVGNATVNTVRWLSGIRGVYLFTSYPLFLLTLLLFSVYLLLLLLRNTGSRGFLLRFFPSVAILVSVLLSCHLLDAREELLLYTRRGTDEYVTLRTNGRTTVINRAEKQAGIFRLLEELTAHRIREIDLLVLTCYEAGAASYLEALTERITVHRLLIVPPIEETEDYHAVLYTAERLKIPFNVKETIQDNGLSLGFLSVVGMKDGHPGFFFRISYRDTEVRYVTQGYLQTTNREAQEAFLAEADLLILGAHAATGMPEAAAAAPPDLSVLVSDPENVKEAWQKEKEGIVLSPDTFVYRLP